MQCTIMSTIIGSIFIPIIVHNIWLFTDHLSTRAEMKEMEYQFLALYLNEDEDIDNKIKQYGQKNQYKYYLYHTSKNIL